jgi:hypothetical protein
MKKTVLIIFLTLLVTLMHAAPNEEIAELILEEYQNCTRITYFDSVSPLPNSFEVAELESLTIEDGILEIKTQVIKEKSRWVRKSITQLNLIWLKTDKKKGETTMTLAFNGYPEPIENSDTLTEVLNEAYEVCNNTFSLIGLVKVPVVINKSNTTITEYTIDDSLLSYIAESDKNIHRVKASLNSLQQVSVKEDKKKGTINVISMFLQQ